MLFNDIIGHKEIQDRLVQTVVDQRVSHAQMFFGETGAGALALAIAFARFISCENRQNNDACGQCKSCLKYKKLVHPDLHFVFPVAITKTIKKDPVSDDFINEWRELLNENPYINLEQWYEKIGVENKQGIISKNESYEILRKLNLKTFESEYKTMIIWMPERMNASSANKLLKILEEPPEKTLFILVAESTDNILPTIISRCQLVKIPKISNEDMSLALKNRFQLNEKILNNVVHLARGNYREALNIMHKGDENDYNFDQFVQLMRLCYSRKILEIFSWVDEVASIGRERQKSLLSFSLRMVRENFISNIQKPEIVFLAEHEAGFSEKFSPFINGRNVMPIYETLNNAHRHIEANGYNKVVLSDMAFKLVKLIKS